MSKKQLLLPWFESFYNQAGNILLTTMIMISVMALFVFSLMAHTLLSLQASQSYTLNHQAFYELEASALQLSSKLKNLAATTCITKQQNPNYSVYLLTKKKSCSFIRNQEVYQYFIADLGVYPCLHIVSNSDLTGSHHWLLTVMSSTREILQLRIAYSEATEPCTEDTVSLIHERIISWRHVRMI